MVLAVIGTAVLNLYCIYGLNLKADTEFCLVMSGIWALWGWIFYSWIWKPLQLKNAGIVMDKAGISINLVKNSGYIPWKDIKGWKVEIESNGEHELHYLYIQTSAKTWKLFLSNLDRGAAEIKKIMEVFSGK